MRITNCKFGKVFVADTVDEFAAFNTSGASSQLFADPSWLGGMGKTEAIQAARNGHLPSVQASEKFMDAFEHLAFRTRTHEVINDVAGGAVNVGAHLAGSPLAMRRRRTSAGPFSPLTIFCDVGSSAMISASRLIERGAAVVALARMLAATRPVTVYAVDGAGTSSYGRSNGFGMVRVNFDDLSRAAFIISHPAAQRGLMYSNIDHMMGSVHGMWACGGIDAYRRVALNLYAEIVQVDPTDCLYLPATYHTDTKNAIEWVNTMLKKYGVADQDAAA